MEIRVISDVSGERVVVLIVIWVVSERVAILLLYVE